MELGGITASVVSFFAGVAVTWLRGIISTHQIRKAVAAELHGVVVTLNFFIMRAMDGGPSPKAQCANAPLKLESFTYYWENEPDRLMRLREWPRLKGWSDRLAVINSGEHPPLFNVVMLLEGLLIPPLDRCVSRDTRRFLKRIADRPEVKAYKVDYLTAATMREIRTDRTDDGFFWN